MNTPSELFDFYGAYMNMYEAADKTQPKPTVLPRSRETNIGDQTTKGWKDRSMAELDWDGKQTERPTNREAQATRLRQVVGTQRRQDIESGIRKEDVDYVLDYLIDEGYTDSYESALVIVEAMSDEWFEDLIDEATKTVMSVSSPEGKQRRLNTTRASSPARNLDNTDRHNAYRDANSQRQGREASSFTPNAEKNARTRNQEQISRGRQGYTDRRAMFVTRGIQKKYGIPDSALDPKERT